MAILSPLRGFLTFRWRSQGFAPWAVFCRRCAACFADIAPPRTRKTISHPSLFELLREHPRDQRWFGVGPLPDVVVYSGVLGGQGISAGFFSGRDTVAREGHRNRLIGRTVEIP